MEKKKCLECNENILGRSDKKFCSDLCRNAYNNRLNSDSNNFVRQVNNTLRKNRRILQELIPEDKIKVHKDKLVNKGFNFNYYTSIYQTKKGSKYFCCYEYWYLPLENEYYFLVLSKKSEE